MGWLVCMFGTIEQCAAHSVRVMVSARSGVRFRVKVVLGLGNRDPLYAQHNRLIAQIAHHT